MDNKLATPNASAFFENVAQIIEKARVFVGRTANLTMCITYFEVGRMIVEEEQGGKARAEYGRGLLAALSSYLNGRVGKGFSESTLRNARKFYQIYAPSIQQALLAESDETAIQQALLAEFENDILAPIGHPLPTTGYPFTLSWTHYLILMRIADDQERRFYEIESRKQQWTYRQLQRQYNSSLYERLALSRDKDEIMRLAPILFI